ncbi:unnamed protein product [Prorocentrum cordatum]|uniref:Uncharacterized protein n=1 Tax=Prorocentrum cordatum TaxID=2364126 RepID=A0ABN9X7X7_9DINO|nr:unnamed protein product [Polarella glacialis]
MERPRRPRLVLHFDVNGTVFVAGPASGVGVAQAHVGNIHLAGAAWGSLAGGEREWSEATLAGKLTSRCPEEGQAALGRFVESPDGAVVGDAFGRIMGAMECDGVRAPPFARREGRDLAVVLRTYGADGPNVSEAIGAFTDGRRPMFPEGCPAARPAERPCAALGRAGDGLRLAFEVDGQEDAKGSRSRTRFAATCQDAFLGLSRLGGTLTMREDDEFWTAGGFSTSCGQRAAERLGCIVPVAPERIILEPDGFVRAVIGHARFRRVHAACVTTFVHPYLPRRLPALLAAAGLPLGRVETVAMIAAGHAEDTFAARALPIRASAGPVALPVGVLARRPLFCGSSSSPPCSCPPPSSSRSRAFWVALSLSLSSCFFYFLPGFRSWGGKWAHCADALGRGSHRRASPPRQLLVCGHFRGQPLRSDPPLDAEEAG